MSSDDETPEEITDAANAVVLNLLPAKSKAQYEKAYNQFRAWCTLKKVKKVTESALLCYLEEKSKTLKPPTLWTIYSMLKTTLNIKENTDLRQFPKLVPYLKTKSVGYRGKKSKVLSREDIERFIREADDETHLLMKVVLIFGISGACRREELVKMTKENIEDVGSILIVKIPDTKTHSERTFTVSNSEYVNIYRKYSALRPANSSSNRVFVKYVKGKCVNQNVGVNKIGEIPSLIAKWLGKEMYKSYTGHCFRRSSATLLANAGGDMVSLKRHGGWKSSTVAEGYIEDSISNKIDISNRICPLSEEITSRNVLIESCLQDPQGAISSTSGINIGSNCSNFTINFYCNKSSVTPQ